MTEDAISIGGVDLSDPDSYLTGPPLDAFRRLRERAPVAWHPPGRSSACIRCSSTASIRCRCGSRLPAAEYGVLLKQRKCWDR